MHRICGSFVRFLAISIAVKQHFLTVLLLALFRARRSQGIMQFFFSGEEREGERPKN
jgi:hypothetical protein